MCWQITPTLKPFLLFNVSSIISSIMIAQMWSIILSHLLSKSFIKCWIRLGRGWANRDLTICWHLFINLSHWGCLFNQLCVNHPTLSSSPHFSPSVYGNIRSRSLPHIICFCSVTIADVICLTVSRVLLQARATTCFFFVAPYIEHVRSSELLNDWLFQPYHSINMTVFLCIYAYSEPIFFLHNY